MSEPQTPPARHWPLVLAIAVIGAAIPLVLYYATLARGAVTPPQAKAILAADPAAVLVDVLSPEHYAARHVQGAESWPIDQILALTAAGDIPQRYQGKKLVLICGSGRTTTRAWQKFHDLGVTDVVQVRGGEEAWIADARNTTGKPWDQFVVAGAVVPPPTREAPLFEQYAAIVAGYVIKPIYGVLSFALIFILWRARRRSPDLGALWWSMTTFFIGEQGCAVDYIFFAGQSYASEYVHCVGMALAFGFATYAIFDGMDRRMIRFSDPAARCAALGLCGQCYKHADVPCGLRRTFLIVIPAMMVLACMPLSAAIHTPSYNTSVFGMFYNYANPAVYQLFESRYCPIAGMVLMAAALAVLLLKKREAVSLSKVLFAAGMGPVGFGLLRMIVSAPYRDNLVWFTFWEEATELLFIASVAFILWTFRRTLFPKAVPAAS